MKYFTQIPIFVVLALFALGLFLAPLALSKPADIGPKPIIALPDPDEIQSGQSTTLYVTLDKTSTTATTVYLSSSHPEVVTMPSSISIPAGHLTGSCEADAATSSLDSGSLQVTITASNANGSAYGYLTVNY